jgi:uncharacterized protein YcfJ
MTRGNPWKTSVLAATATALVLGVGVAIGNFANRDEAEPAHHPAAASAPSTRANAAPMEVVEDCNQYATQTRRDTGRIVRDGVVGGAVGAGVGAAGGAIAGGGDGAGKGAGIGAIAGVAAGTLYGLNDENRKSESARTAYQQCMARRGY